MTSRVPDAEIETVAYCPLHKEEGEDFAYWLHLLEWDGDGWRCPFLDVRWNHNGRNGYRGDE